MHVVANVLSRLLNISEPLGVPNQKCGYVIIFYKTYMDVRNENLFKDKSNAKIFKPSSETKVG